MSKILITGNGFDLFHGLPTKYGHFMAVMKIIEDIEEKQEYGFYDLFDENFGLEFFNDNMRIHECFNVDKIIFNKDSIEEIKHLLQENLWYNHFKTVLEIDTWIDFEMEIYEFIKEIDDFNDTYKTNNNESDFFWKSSNFDFVKHLDFFDGIEIRSEFKDRKNRLNYKFIFDKLKDSLVQFIEIFNKYLLFIVNQFYENNIIEVRLPFQLMDKIYTFNYTPTIEKVYQEKSILINYLHGKSSENNIVLGINNLPKICLDNHCFYFLKKRQRISNGTNIDFNFDENFFSFKKPTVETIFYIIGHSLDESDKDYIEKLFEFLENDKTQKTEICVFYISKIDKEKKIDNLFKIIGQDKIIKYERSDNLRFVELTFQNISIEFKRNLTYKEKYNIS